MSHANSNWKYIAQMCLHLRLLQLKWLFGCWYLAYDCVYGAEACLCSEPGCDLFWSQRGERSRNQWFPQWFIYGCAEARSSQPDEKLALGFWQSEGAGDVEWQSALKKGWVRTSSSTGTCDVHCLYIPLNVLPLAKFNSYIKQRQQYFIKELTLWVAANFSTLNVHCEA